MNGKLLFCDHIFNGYGNARKDFKKQMMKTRLEAIQGFSLPTDFKFRYGEYQTNYLQFDISVVLIIKGDNLKLVLPICFNKKGNQLNIF